MQRSTTSRLTTTFINLALIAMLAVLGSIPAIAGGQNMEEDSKGITIWTAKSLPMEASINGVIRTEFGGSNTGFIDNNPMGYQTDFSTRGVGALQFNFDMNRRNDVEVHWKLRLGIGQRDDARLGLLPSKRLRVEEAGYSAQWGSIDFKGGIGRVPFGIQGQSYAEEREFLSRSDAAAKTAYDPAVQLCVGSSLGHVSFLVGGGVETDYSDDIDQGVRRGGIVTARVAWTSGDRYTKTDGPLSPVSNYDKGIMVVGSYSNDYMGNHFGFGMVYRTKQWSFQAEGFRDDIVNSRAVTFPFLFQDRTGAYVQVLRSVSGFTTGARISYSEADLKGYPASEERTEATLHVGRELTTGTFRTRLIAEVTGFRAKYPTREFNDNSGTLAAQLSF